MTVHLLRDYNIPATGGNLTTFGASYIAIPYLIVIYLRHVLGYIDVGNTNFSISPIAFGLVSASHGAGVQRISGNNEILIPTSVRTVSSGDIGNCVAVKSNTNPLFNSGVFKITAIDSVNNGYIIDYRSNDTPPTEALNSCSWWMYASETTAPLNNGTSGTGYAFDGAATASRIIMQSPHTVGWQLQFTNMGLSNTGFGEYYCMGFGGNSAGDFAQIPNSIGQMHTNYLLLINQGPGLSNQFMNTFGFPPFGGGGHVNYRISVIGDDGGQALTILIRIVGGSGGGDGIITIGVPNNEPSDNLNLPSQCRAFIWGIGSGGVIQYIMGPSMPGWAIGPLGTLAMAAPGGFNASNTNSLPGYSGLTIPAWDSNAGNTPWTGTTEIFPVEIFTGMAYGPGNGSPVNNGPLFFPGCLNLMGNIPYVAEGRANFPVYTLTDDKGWYHSRAGVFLQWNNGATPLP